MQEFVNSLSAYNLIIYKTYSARERYDKSGSAKTLCENIKKQGVNAVYAKNQKQLFNAIEKKAKGAKKVLCLGAGDIYEKIKNFLEK